MLCAGCAKQNTGVKPLLVWSGMDAEFPTLLKQCQEFEKQNPGLKVEVLKVPYKDLRNKFLIAAPAGLGPDILVGPQDWIGVLSVADQLQPIPEGVISKNDYFPVAIDSVKFNKQMYMAPLCMECIALFRNTDLMPKRPETMKDLLAEAKSIQEKSHNQVKGFYFEIKDLYFSLPFLVGEGAYLLGKDADGEYNPSDIGMSNEGAIRGAKFLRSLVADKYIELGATENTSRALFLENKAAVIVNGPWFLEGVKKAGIHYAIDPFPVSDSGNIPRPSLGVQGFMMSKFSARPQEAAKLVSFLSSDQNMAEMSKTSGRPPVKMKALDLCSDNPDIVAFTKICSTGVPMPTHPAVGQVWEPMKQSLELISKGQVETETELKAANDLIVQKIKLMLE